MPERLADRARGAGRGVVFVIGRLHLDPFGGRALVGDVQAIDQVR